MVDRQCQSVLGVPNVRMEVNEATELRKLPALHHAELGRILDDMDNWKNLMSKIPKILEKENFRCDVTLENLPKYVSEHFRLIEQASKKTNRSCSEILFEEWGCSGRIRPSVGHLFHLLQKAELYRAADYVAKNILHREPPPRPNSGPLAQVKFNTIERQKLEDSTLQDIEQILDAIDYPSSAIEQIRNSINLSSSEDNVARVVPKIVISEISTFDARHNPFSYAIPVSHERSSSQIDVKTNSDMMKFSESNVESSRPPISMLLNESNKSLQSNELPNLTELNIAESTQNSSEAQSNNMPNLSALMRTNSEHSVTAASREAPDLSNSNQIHLSDLMRTNSAPSVSTPAQEQASSASAFLPATLKSSSANIMRSTSVERIHGSKASSANSKQCTSPLPSLSLNTHLPHFTYSELEAATNNFDETPYVENGRFLGSGGFSSVYLALNMLNRAVAVKRINLKDLNIVKADDFITKQFKNEVEVLCKYKHDNLLSLIGYSCDGLTYCLLYEFMPGGNLEDRLEKAKEELIWTQRLHIAMGTARAINYLHTAYSSPLIHRDVKSANILLDCTNKPKLSDFGIMRISSSSTTETSHIFGTAAYMAPEALRGDVSVKMDTYSFGVVLLELITGLPSRGCNRAGIDLITHVQDSLNDEENISSLLDTSAGSWVSKNFNFANELYKIAGKCLQYKKNKRPTMTDVTTMLSQVLQQS